MFSRSFWLGRSTKNISSKRPFRNNSGGRRLILFAVATTNTGEVFSCIHVRIVENILEVTPPSVTPLDCTPLNPFSISSIHNTHGATASAVMIALRILSSLLPTKPW